MNLSAESVAGSLHGIDLLSKSTRRGTGLGLAMCMIGLTGPGIFMLQFAGDQHDIHPDTDSIRSDN